mmetsp:Transcript_30622/g.55522  ORF Transcript_30622/g.55522 Transcript_30622/m.55522 type:complete len:376 (+) Transcript_30622:923-2050(+)
MFGRLQKHIANYINSVMPGDLSSQGQVYYAVLLVYLLSPLLAIAFIRLTSYGTAEYRKWLLRSEEPLPQKPSPNLRQSLALRRQSGVNRCFPTKLDGNSVVGADDSEVAIWEHEVCHGESECAALVAGFLVRQFLLYMVDRQIPSNSGRVQSEFMGAVMYLCVSVLVIVHGCLTTFESSPLVAFLQECSSWTTSWCTVSLVRWVVKQRFVRDDHQALTILAVASCLCIAAVWLLDRLEAWRMLTSFQMNQMVLIVGAITGLCWEQTFGWAVKEVIKEDLFGFQQSAQRILSRSSPVLLRMTTELKLFEVLTYALMLWVILPAWWKYMVPPASIESSPEMLALRTKVGHFLQRRKMTKGELQKDTLESHAEEAKDK